jgi:hypothetical protein
MLFYKLYSGPETEASRKGVTEMSGKGRQMARKPATKFAQLRKKMEKTRIVSNVSKKKKRLDDGTGRLAKTALP